MNGPMLIVWILVFFGIFYFLAIRPQRRQKQVHAEMVSMLKKGDEIVTIGGMFGTVTGIGDDWVEIEIAKRTRVRLAISISTQSSPMPVTVPNMPPIVTISSPFLSIDTISACTCFWRRCGRMARK